jgi:enoyl-CoA hydratase/carnithine racemase
MEACSSFFLPRLVGFSRAMYLVSTGAVYPPNSKHFGDLFAETLPDPSQVLPRALELAADIAQNVSPLASHLNRSLMWRGADSAEGAHLLDSSVIYHMFAGPYVLSPRWVYSCGHTDTAQGPERRRQGFLREEETQLPGFG